MRDYEQIARLAELAEETALAELAEFGDYEPPEFGNVWAYPHVLRADALAESFAGVFGAAE